jgi:hypothetical protein
MSMSLGVLANLERSQADKTYTACTGSQTELPVRVIAGQWRENGQFSCIAATTLLREEPDCMTKLTILLWESIRVLLIRIYAPVPQRW